MRIWIDSYSANTEACDGKDQDPTIVVEDSPEQEKYELLKEKLKYKQAERENSKRLIINKYG